MDAAFVAATRDSYDALAAEHGDVVASGLDDRPLDRALFAAFAELVRAGGNGPVADVGCGAGRVTILLSRLGLDAFGIDLSPGMQALAGRTYPQLRFPDRRAEPVQRVLGNVCLPRLLPAATERGRRAAARSRLRAVDDAVREGEGTEKTTQGYLLARKPRPECLTAMPQHR